MISPFFVMIASCGFFSCYPPKIIDFDNREACIAVVEVHKRNNIDDGVTCFDRRTGEIVLDIKGRK